MKVSQYNSLRQFKCESLVPSVFHVYLPVTELLFDDIETGPHSYAVLFKSGHNTYALLVAEEGYNHTLGDVQRIVKNMGLEAQRFFPPGADPSYFYEEGMKHFLDVYPSLKQWKKEDVTFYQSLASYSPALVRLSSVGGEIRRFNARSNAWQKAFDYTFKKIQVI